MKVDWDALSRFVKVSVNAIIRFIVTVPPFDRMIIYSLFGLYIYIHFSLK